MLCDDEQDGAELEKDVDKESMAGVVGQSFDIVGGAALNGAEVNAAVGGSGTGIG